MSSYQYLQVATEAAGRVRELEALATAAGDHVDAERAVDQYNLDVEQGDREPDSEAFGRLMEARDETWAALVAAVEATR